MDKGDKKMGKNQKPKSKIPADIQNKMNDSQLAKIDHMTLKLAKYLIRLTQFKKEDQIEESILAFA